MTGVSGGSDDAATPTGGARRRRQPPSLRARALRLLAQREHSRAELRRKLASHVDPPEQIGKLDALLDELERDGWLSDARFVQSVVQRRAPRHGLLRVRHDLGAHGLDDPLVSAALADMRATELQRALAVWRKRFHQPPADRAERARQQRFLAQRGFEPATIHQVFRLIEEGGDAA